MLNHASFNWSSTPGSPYKNLFPSNAEALAQNGLQLVIPIIIDRIIKINSMSLEEIEHLIATKDYATLLGDNLIDLISVFVKNEPHTLSKKEAKRWRLVCAVSLVTQFIERMLYTPMYDAQINDWVTSPIKIGIGFNEEVEEFVSDLPFCAGTSVKSSDVRAYDMSRTRAQDIDHDEVVLRVMDCSDNLKLFIRKFEKLNTVQLFLLSNSRVVKLVDESGLKPVQISGRYQTLERNSVVRVLVSYQCQLDSNVPPPLVAAIALGDDCLERSTLTDEQFARWYEAYASWTITDQVTSVYPPVSFEFCSHDVNVTTCKATLKNWPKTLYKFLTKDPTRYSKVEQVIFVTQLMDQIRETLGESLDQLLRLFGWGEALGEWEELAKP